MSIFAYSSGSVEQIGGNISLPKTLTHLPIFQGANFTLPPGLTITGERSFIWELAKPYSGVIGITNPTSETPTINFDPLTFSEPFIEIKCRVKGQPLNFVIYYIYTALSTTFKAGASISSSIEATGYSIIDPSFTIDNSIITEANYAQNILSNLILFWKERLHKNVKHYKVEKWGNGWEYVGITTRPSYIVPKEEITYRITPVFKLDKPGIETPITIPVLLNGLLSKDIFTLYQSSFNYISHSQPKNEGIFYTVFKTSNQQDSLSLYQETTNYNNLNQSTETYNNVFWIQVQKYGPYTSSLSLYQESNSYNQLQQSNNTYSEIFWSKSIGI